MRVKMCVRTLSPVDSPDVERHPPNGRRGPCSRMRCICMHGIRTHLHAQYCIRSIASRAWSALILLFPKGRLCPVMSGDCTLRAEEEAFGVALAGRGRRRTSARRQGRLFIWIKQCLVGYR